MESANLSESWRDLYVMLGTSSAALIGLLFVATSLHLDEIVNNTIYRLRARNLLLHLIVTLIQAAAILTPQPLVPLGGELLVASLFGLWFPLSIAFTAFVRNRAMGKSGNFSIYRAIGFIGSYLLAIAGAVAIFSNAHWGMYLVTASYVGALFAAVWNAWMIMVGVGQMEKPQPR
jgi:hypothetical protein